MYNDDKNKDSDLTLFDKLFEEQLVYEPSWKRSERAYNSQFESQQYKRLKKKKRSKIFVPVTRNTVNIIKSIFATAFFSDGNPIELVAVGDEEKELVTYRNKVLDYYYEKYKPAKELIKAFHSSLLFKMGIVITYWDSDRCKVITTHIPVTDIAFDNECTNIDDIEVIAYKHYESNRVVLQKIEDGFYNQPQIKKKLFNNENEEITKRKEIKILYSRRKKGWRSKTFIDNTLVRVAKFKNLPFQYGHCISKLPKIDEEERATQILCYGDDIPTYLKELQYEINYKRNVKNDIQEKILNPDVYVSDLAKLDPADLTYGAGRRIRVQGDVNQVKERTVPSEYALNNDLAMLAGDVQSAVGVNAIQEGQTSSSDRRSANAMAVINSNSSMRIEEMIMLIKETLFEHWAKTWTKIVMRNASDDVISKITSRDDFPLGRLGERDEIEFDLKINFGMTLDKQQKINDKLQAYQMTAQNPNINPKIVEGLLKDLLMLIVGDDTNLTELFEGADEISKPTQEEMAQQEQINNIVNGGL